MTQTPQPIAHATKFIDDFKNFAVKGNAVELAVGVIVGASFGKVITSLVADILTPPISLLIGRVNFSNLFIVLSGSKRDTLDAAKAAGDITVNYGLFVSTVLDFLLVTFVVFVLLRVVNRLKEKPLVNEKTCPRCLSSVKKAATRCSFCTSDLSVEPVASKA